MTEYSNDPGARDELQRIASQVGGFEPLADRISREKEIEGLPRDDKRRKPLERQMRRDNPPTETQKDLKRFYGLALIVGITAATALLIQQSQDHFMAAHLATLDYKTTAAHINPLNIVPSLQRLADDRVSELQNNLIGWGERVGAVVTGVTDVVVTVFKRPWKKPLRRGIF